VILGYLRDALGDEGYAVTAVSGGVAAVEAAAREDPHLALLDLMMPDLGGLEVLKRLREEHPATRVLMMTANATVETALEAMKLGAVDYLIKPFALDELKLHVRRALREVSLTREVETLKREVARADGGRELLGDSPVMRAVRDLIARVAPEAAPVLVRGETGTGKELVARALHQDSPRGEGVFLAVNCGAMPETLLERELFGNERGAFTGADAARPGLVEAAADGTLFLDEIGELPLALQVKLLRVVEGHEFYRVGGTRPVRPRVRLVAATNRDLARAVAEGRFRQDLYYRLNVVAIDLPPLRTRGEDAIQLAEHFLKSAAVSHRRAVAYAPDAAAALRSYPWPGNVRELKNVIERAVILATGPTLAAADLRLEPADGAPAPGGVETWHALPFKDAKRLFEHAYLAAALKEAGGNIARAAARTGIDRNNLKDKLKAHKLGGEKGSE
jgi:DNA-binding NtrC family response regulator